VCTLQRRLRVMQRLTNDLPGFFLLAAAPHFSTESLRGPSQNGHHRLAYYICAVLRLARGSVSLFQVLSGAPPRLVHQRRGRLLELLPLRPSRGVLDQDTHSQRKNLILPPLPCTHTHYYYYYTTLVRACALLFPLSLRIPNVARRSLASLFVYERTNERLIHYIVFHCRLLRIYLLYYLVLDR
jgi:hypothetical protein